MKSYSQKLTERIRAADGKKIGVKLGRLCIKHSVSVASVAEKLKISRPTVYSWFEGKADPIPSLQDKVEKLIGFLESR